MIFIRTDANDIIASGHLMRCLSIAKELVKHGEVVKFIISDQQSAKLLENTEFEYICLDSDWKNLALEVPFVSRIIIEQQCKLLIVDTYSVTQEYFESFKNMVNLVYIDDLFKEKYSVDILINYNLYYKQFNYDNRYKGETTTLLLGPQYVPLREEFQSIQQIDINPEIENVLLICGGGDCYNFLGSFVKKLTCQKNISGEINWHVIIGAYNQHEKEIREYALLNPKVHVYSNIKNMRQLIMSCDLVISAASTVLYECVACQRPVMFFCAANNQEWDIQAFQLFAKMIYLGDIRTEMEKVIKNSFDVLKRVKKHEISFCEMLCSMQNLVDGNGARRISEEVCNLIEGTRCLKNSY